MLQLHRQKPQSRKLPGKYLRSQDVIICLVRFPTIDAGAYSHQASLRSFWEMSVLSSSGVTMCLLHVLRQISCKRFIIVALVAFVGLLSTVGRKPAVIRVSPPPQGTMNKGKKCAKQILRGIVEIGAQL